jgi:putative ABC transport system permease protein
MRTYEGITRVGLTFGGQLIEHGQNYREGSVAQVGTNFFDVLGTRPLLGRTFVASDENADVKPVVVSDRLVSTLFRDNESPIGARILINRQARVIIGVVPSTANFPHEQYWAWDVAPFATTGMYIRLVRLRDGASALDADRELKVVANRIAAAAGEDPRSVAFRFHAAADPEFQIRGFALGLILAVAAVMLVACANLANIQLARGLGRRHELALRAALGATRRRVIVHLLSESVLLGAIGLVLGLVLTYWGARALTASIPKTVGEYFVDPQFSWRVLAFSIGATLLCIFLVGLLPAIKVSRADPNELLKSGAGTGATRSNRRLYGVLIGAEIALALALSSGAAVLIRSWMLANSIRFAFDPGTLAIANASMWLPSGATRYSDVLQSFVARMGSVRDASSVAASMGITVENGDVSIDDGGSVRDFASPGYRAYVVTPGYLRTLGLPIVRGRDFADGERDHAAVIVDERTATALWPNANPIGASIKLGDRRSNRPYARVVGVVTNIETRIDRRATRDDTRGIRSLGRVYYLPAASDEFVPAKGYLTNLQIIARSNDHPAQLPLNIRRELSGWADVVTSQASSWEEYQGLTAMRNSERFVASLFTLFAALGVGLAAFGVYGVVAHSVAERRRELGVRVAMGATNRDILHAVLRENVVVALTGVAIGLLLTKYGVLLLGAVAVAGEEFNAPLFAAVAAMLIATVTVSAFIPALRATRIDPTESLRNE